MKSGIYKIINLKNRKCYIGSSIDIKDRFRDHKSYLKKNKHHCIALQRAYNKYGVENFLYDIIEHCDSSILIEREQYYLDNLKPEYNSLKIAGSSKGYKFGKQSKETCELKSKNSSRKRKVDIYTLKGEYLETKNSLTEATKLTKISQIHIREICLGIRFSRNGYRFKYSEDEKLVDREFRLSRKIKLKLME